MYIFTFTAIFTHVSFIPLCIYFLKPIYSWLSQYTLKITSHLSFSASQLRIPQKLLILLAPLILIAGPAIYSLFIYLFPLWVLMKYRGEFNSFTFMDLAINSTASISFVLLLLTSSIWVFARPRFSVLTSITESIGFNKSIELISDQAQALIFSIPILLLFLTNSKVFFRFSFVYPCVLFLFIPFISSFFVGRKFFVFYLFLGILIFSVKMLLLPSYYGFSFI